MCVCRREAEGLVATEILTHWTPLPAALSLALTRQRKCLEAGRLIYHPSLPFSRSLSFLPPPFPFRSLFLSLLLWGLVTELEGTWVINVEFKWAYQVKSSFAPLGYSPLMKNSSDKLTVQYHIVNTDDSPRFITKQKLQNILLLLREKGISQLNFIVYKNALLTDMGRTTAENNTHMPLGQFQVHHFIWFVPLKDLWYDSGDEQNLLSIHELEFELVTLHRMLKWNEWENLLNCHLHTFNTVTNQRNFYKFNTSCNKPSINAYFDWLGYSFPEHFFSVVADIYITVQRFVVSKYFWNVLFCSQRQNSVTLFFFFYKVK